MRIRPVVFFVTLLMINSSIYSFGQTVQPMGDSLTLEECIQYAMKNQPYVQQALIDQEIAERDIRIGLSGWYPQINATGNYNHYLKLPVFVLPNFTDPTQPPQIIRNGLKNTSNAASIT